MNPKSGLLPVSNIHKISYEVCGNEEALPILFVHGGPGGGYAEEDKRFFDFNVQRVIFFDQRGASKSTPFGTIEENTTQHLVDDIITLLDFLQLDKVVLFGGSWGTTLSLVFAIQNPKRVQGMILRGVFLANNASLQHYLNGGVYAFYPQKWNRFKNNVPEGSKRSIANFYLDKMIHGTADEKKHYCYEWAFYEISIFKKGITEKDVSEILNHIPFESLAILEAHYASHNFFLEENYILNHLYAIKDIPTKIVHGNEDVICLPEFAVTLHSGLNHSELFLVEGGHSDSEPQIEEKLIEIIKNTVW